MRLRRTRGPASNHLCVRCAEDGKEVRAAEWALVHGESGADPWADYVPLCSVCHKQYDKPHLISLPKAWKASADSRRGKPLPAHIRAKISETKRTRNA